MEVVAYRPEMAGDTASHYNQQTAGVPFCWPITGEHIAAAVENAGDLTDAEVRVALDGSRVLGFGMYGVERTKDCTRGVIRFLCYERGNRRAGQTLLKAVESELDAHGVDEIEAFSQDRRIEPYHLRAAFLSDHLDHVQALFAINGYARDRGEVFLLWKDVPELPVEPADGLTFDANWIDTDCALPDLKVSMTCGGVHAGQCDHVSAATFTGHADAQDMAFCVWLGVPDDHQGRGYGAIVLRRAMALLRERGYRHLAISTGQPNHRAFVFYANYGYRVADWTWEYRLKR